MRKGVVLKTAWPIVALVAAGIILLVVFAFISHFFHGSIFYDICRTLATKLPVIGDVLGKFIGCETFIMVS